MTAVVEHANFSPPPFSPPSQQRLSFRSGSEHRMSLTPGSHNGISPRTTIIDSDSTPLSGSWPKADANTRRSSLADPDMEYSHDNHGSSRRSSDLNNTISPNPMRRSRASLVAGEKELRLSSHSFGSAVGSGGNGSGALYKRTTNGTGIDEDVVGELPPSPPSSRLSSHRSQEGEYEDGDEDGRQLATPQDEEIAFEEQWQKEVERETDSTQLNHRQPDNDKEATQADLKRAKHEHEIIVDPLSTETVLEGGDEDEGQDEVRGLRAGTYSEYGTQSRASPLAVRREPRIPHSSYYTGAPGMDAAFGTSPVGKLGVHHPREIIRVERDYSSGELPQFHPSYPLELEGRITPTQFHETINDINEVLISAYDTRASCIENALAFFTFQLSALLLGSRYNKEMRRLAALLDEKNTTIYHPQGLHILWPRKSAFMFLEIEYY